jgi:hypothetical protein
MKITVVAAAPVTGSSGRLIVDEPEKPGSDKCFIVGHC